MRRVGTVLLVLLFSVCACTGGATPDATEVATATPTGTIQIEAGLVYTNHSVVRLARETIWLVNGDVLQMAKDGGYEATTSGDVQLYYFVKDLIDYASSSNFNSPSANFRQTYSDFSEHVVTTSITDFDGIAEFDTLPAGNSYYLFMFTEINDGLVVWNMPITIESGENSVILAQDNASWVSGS